MGLSHSSDEPAEGLEENHTPVTHRRVQKLVDPRSPTDDVQRTPMQRSVDDDDDFEDPRSPTSRIARTPVPDDSDPRSPTAGREPGTGPFVFPDPVPEDPRSPTINVARTPICKDAPKDTPFETVTVHQAGHTMTESSQGTGNNDQESNGENTKTLSTENTESETDKTNDSPAGGDTNKCENGHKIENTPEYEMKLSELMEKQAIANEEAANEDRTTLVLSDRELVFLTELPPSPATASSTLVLTSSSKSSTTAKPKAGHNALNLKGIIHTLSASTMTTTATRSPLSTRNLLQDSPDPTYQRSRTAPKVGVAYGKAGIRRRLMADDDDGINGKTRAQVDVGRTVGRYYPVVDKENY